MDRAEAVDQGSALSSRRPTCLILTAALALVASVAVFAAGTTVFGPRTYTRGAGKPVAAKATFTVNGPTGLYTLRVVNHGVTSAVITLNGRKIFEPGDFTRNEPLLEERVTPRDGVNEIIVELRSRPGSSLTVEVTGDSATDTTPPTITAVATPAPNAAGWNKSDVTVTFTCADTGSGIATCPAPVTVTAEGTTPVSGMATDNAGNTASASVTLNIDTMAPGVTVSTDADLSEWGRTPVTAHFTCDDGGSGIDTCPAAQTATGEGANQTLTGIAVDKAGNSASATTPAFSIDFTAPEISITLSAQPNANGWNNDRVTAHFTCTDSRSGIETCPEDQVIDADGADQVMSGVAVDRAGNQSAPARAAVSIDRTPPTIALSYPLDGATLFAANLVATGTTSDVLSGVADVACNNQPATTNAGNISCAVTFTPGPNTLTATATDRAGNTGTSEISLTYTRVPTVQIAEPANLSIFNISPTTVLGTVDDDTVASVTINSIPVPVINRNFSHAVPIAEGPNVITVSATSATGVVGTASVEVTLDTTPPHVSVTSPQDQFETTADSISVAGIVNDIVVGTVNEREVGVTVSRLGNAVTASVANRTFLATNVPLDVGVNVIDVVAVDTVGNQATTAITVRRALVTAPEIRLISGNNQSGRIGSVLPQDLVVAVTDALGNPLRDKRVVFKVTQNDGMVAAIAADGVVSASAVTATTVTNTEGFARARWTLGNRAGAGGNVLEAYPVGIEGTAVIQGTTLFAATGTLGAAGKIVIDTGNDQTAATNQGLPKPLLAVVVDEGNNRLGEVEVTFTVKAGGGSFEGQQTLTVTTDSDGRAAATLTLGPQEGNGNNIVEATFPLNQTSPATFRASGRAPGNPANTTISGVVLDNSNVPIPGVTVRAVLTTDLRSSLAAVQNATEVTTNAEGQFTIPQAPVGFVKLMVDGTTAPPVGTYPILEYDIVTVAGQNNTVGQPIFLLPINHANEKCVGPNDAGGTLLVPEAPGFSLTFSYGQVTFPGGSQTGCISVTVVHGDKVPMVPGFGQQPRFIVTIQPAGAVFNPPAAITLPNVDGLKPRQVTEMYSFDHDIGSFVAIGTGIVSDDGLEIRSSPGVGVLKAGWHCGGDPSSSGGAASLSVTLTAAQAEVTAGNTVDMTANGSPPQDGIYINWEVIDDPADPDDDPSVASFTSTPGCNDQPTCVAPLKGTKIGIASVRVTFQCTTTGATVTSDIVKVKFKVGLKVKEISFFDDLDIYKDKVGSAPKIPELVWKDTNAADENEPVAYVKASTMKVTVKFEVSPVPTSPVTGVTIEGEIPGLGKFKKTGVTIPAAAEMTESDITADTPLPTTTKFYNTMNVTWRHVPDGKACPGPLCSDDGASAHKVYVTLATPSQPKLFLTTLHLAVSKDGASDPKTAADNSWSLFAGPANITAWDGTRKLYYYRAGVGFVGCALTEEQLLTAANGSGQCGSFAHLLMAVFATNGIASEWVNIETVDGLQFLVKRWTRGVPSYPGAPDYKWSMQFNLGDPMVPPQPGGVFGDLTNTPDLKGQNSAPPSEKLFARHFIVKMTLNPAYSYYDPSYGATYLGADRTAAANYFETNAVEGYVRRFIGDAPGVWRLRDALGQHNIIFDR